MTNSEKKTEDTERILVQFQFFKVNESWEQLSDTEKNSAAQEVLSLLKRQNVGRDTHTFSTMGLRADTDFMIWRTKKSPEELEQSYSELKTSKFGQHITITHSFFGLIRDSRYIRKPSDQEQAVSETTKLKYFILYPFTKTTDWYLLSPETRQGMMNEHIRVGRNFPTIRQILVYSNGLGDQEFMVGYESEDLQEFQDLVIALRSTEARRYTLVDTPIFTGVNRSLKEILALLGAGE
jgi:chlorite dismutase